MTKRIHHVKSVIVLCFAVLFETMVLFGQSPEDGLTLARVKYSGGGDWYNDPSSLPNLARYINQQTRVHLAEKEVQVALTSEALFSFPILFLTGHGHIQFNENESEALRQYLLQGGFLYADDDYGMDPSFRSAIQKVFPDRDWVELPFQHGIYSVHFPFPNGLPKIHEHDNKPPKGLAILDDNGRVMIFYTVETNLSDGWADENVHNDPPEKREEAFRMGTNIILWAMLH